MVKEDELPALENEFLEYQLLDDDELPATSTVMADGTSMNIRVDEESKSLMLRIVSWYQAIPALRNGLFLIWNSSNT